MLLFILSACSNPTLPTKTSTPPFAEAPSPTSTIEIATATPQSDMGDHPIFLAWPLPANIGLARISQYPNSPWTWNYLGLNEGYQCPPMFGYLLDLGSLPYWRDISIPETEDMAQADPHNFEMVECYSSSDAVGANGHEGTDIKAPAGTPVHAAADGKIQEWRLTGMNSMIVLKHCLGGAWDSANQCSGGKQWYTTYMHIVTNKDLFTENLAVPQGTQVGAIYDQTINSHLHFEVGLEKRSYRNFTNPWGRDESPWLGCMWLNQSLCPRPNPEYNLMAFYTNTGELSVKQGEIKINIRGAQNARWIRLWGNRIALLDSQGDLFVHDGHFDADENSVLDWLLLAEHVLDFQITDQRTAILDSDGNLFVNESDQRAGWVLQAQQVRAFSISNHRVGYLASNGELFIKEGNLNEEWIPLANNVSAFQLNDNRIAIADSQGNLAVNEGDVRAEWKQMAEKVKAFQLTNLRVGILDAENNLLVKEGNLRAEWVLLAKGVTSFQLSNYRVLVILEDGTLKYVEI